MLSISYNSASHCLFQGTYLDSLKNICEVCDYCKKGETVVQQCQSWQNTVCRNKNRDEQEQTTTVLPQTKPITAKTTTMQWQGGQFVKNKIFAFPLACN